MTLPAEEFIRRFLLHILPGRFHRIRYYGFLANGDRSDNIALCRRLLTVRPANAAPATDHDSGDHQINTCDFTICPECGGTMRRIAVVPRFFSHQPFRCDTS